MSIMNTIPSLLNSLSTRFFRGSYNFILSSEDVHHMTWDWQEKLLEATVNSELNRKYPMSAQFTKLFLKKIMDYLEKQNVEIHDDFFIKLCDTMNNTNEDYCYRHYFIKINSKEIITIKETNKMVVNGTTGMRTWEAGLMLADWALCNKEVFNKKNVIELGSGVGFSGVTIAKLCTPKSIYLTDCHPAVLKAICDNILINCSVEEKESSNGSVFMNGECEIGVKYLDWTNVDDVSNCTLPNVVIGADIIYDPTIIKPLCNILKMFFDKNKELEVYIASVIRNKETFDTFLENLDSMNLIYTKLEFPHSVNIDWDENIEKCFIRINVNNISYYLFLFNPGYLADTALRYTVKKNHDFGGPWLDLLRNFWWKNFFFPVQFRSLYVNCTCCCGL